MLTIEQCRATLAENDKDLTDEQVEKIRDSLYGLANIALDMYLEDKLKPLSQISPSPETPVVTFSQSKSRRRTPSTFRVNGDD